MYYPVLYYVCINGKHDIALGIIPSPSVSHSQPTANRDAIRILMWNVEGITSTLTHTTHDLATQDIVVFTETMATCVYCATGRLWMNSLATQGERGRHSGGISIGLNLNRNWLADKVFQSKHMLCVRTRVLVIVACYYPPNRDVSDILDDLADGIAKLSNCGTPIVIAGDFNCRIDSGTRGHELTSALSDIGFTCHNDPAHHTYISKQGVSTIDLVFTDSVSDHKFRVDVPTTGARDEAPACECSV